MPDLLLEFFSEEIPARMQPRAMEDLKKLVTDRLVEAGLVYEGAKAFATPRRIALAVHGMPAKQKDIREEKKGPRVGAPEAAVAGFLKSAGLASLDQAKIEKDPKKGEFYVAVIEKPGRAAIEVIAEIVPDIVRKFPWPKSMRWGPASAKPGALTLGAAAAFDRRDLRPGDRRPASRAVRCRRARKPATLPSAIASWRRRRSRCAARTTGWRSWKRPRSSSIRSGGASIISTEAKNLAFAQGYELIEDEGLLVESRRSGRMAGGADGIVRRELPRRSRRK